MSECSGKPAPCSSVAVCFGLYAIVARVSGDTPTKSNYSARWGGIGAVAVLAGVFGAYWYAYILTQRPPLLNDYAGDILRIHLPNVLYAANAVQAGELPLWNPNEFCGMPMLAGMEFGPLYPPNWLFLLLPLDIGHLLGALLHQCILGIGVYMYLRRSLRLTRYSAVFGALCVGLSGWSTFRMLTEFDAYRTAAYIPWVLLLCDRLMAAPTLRQVSALAFVLALQFLAGEIEVWVRTLMLLGAYAVFRLAPRAAQERVRKPLRPALALGSALLLAVGLVMIQLAPTFEASQYSLRSTSGLSFDHAFRGGVSSATVLLGTMAVYDYPAHGHFFGYLPLLFAVYALLQRRGDAWFFAALAAVSFALILGDKTFVARIYYALPTGNWFRAPIRFLPFLILACGVLSALGLERFRADTHARRRRALALMLLFALLIPAMLSRAAASRIEFTSALIAGIVLVAVAIAARQRPAIPARAMAGVVVIGAYLALPVALYDLREFNIPKPLDFIGPAAKALPKLREGLSPGDRVYVDYAFETGRRQPKFGTVTGIPAINGVSPYMPRVFWDFIFPYSSSRVLAYHEREGFESMSVQSGLWGGLAFESGALDAFNILGVRRIGMGLGSELLYSEAGEKPVPAELHSLYDSGAGPLFERFSVWDNPSAWPRAFVVNDEAIDSIEQLVATYKRSAQPATITRYSASRVTISVPSNGGLLVLTDQHYPGWFARVDGRPAPIDPVATLFRGVRIPAGVREVEFVYRPRSFWVGVAATAASICIGIVFLLPWHRWNRRFAMVRMGRQQRTD